MFSNLGPTHPKAAEAPVDDVEGHRISMFIEDQKDAVTGPLPTVDKDAGDEPDGDVEGHIILP